MNNRSVHFEHRKSGRRNAITPATNGTFIERENRTKFICEFDTKTSSLTSTPTIGRDLFQARFTETVLTRQLQRFAENFQTNWTEKRRKTNDEKFFSLRSVSEFDQVINWRTVFDRRFDRWLSTWWAFDIDFAIEKLKINEQRKCLDETVFFLFVNQEKSSTFSNLQTFHDDLFSPPTIIDRIKCISCIRSSLLFSTNVFNDRLVNLFVQSKEREDIKDKFYLRMFTMIDHHQWPLNTNLFICVNISQRLCNRQETKTRELKCSYVDQGFSSFCFRWSDFIWGTRRRKTNESSVWKCCSVQHQSLSLWIVVQEIRRQRSKSLLILHNEQENDKKKEKKSFHWKEIIFVQSLSIEFNRKETNKTPDRCLMSITCRYFIQPTRITLLSIRVWTILLSTRFFPVQRRDLFSMSFDRFDSTKNRTFSSANKEKPSKSIENLLLFLYQQSFVYNEHFSLAFLVGAIENDFVPSEKKRDSMH